METKFGAKELIIKWFINNLANDEFNFGTHLISEELPDFGFFYIGKYYSAGTYDRKFRNIKEEFKYNSELKVSSLLSRNNLTIEEVITENKSREKHYIVRRIQHGEIH